MPYIGTCFRFFMQMRVEKKTKHLHIEFIVTSHNSGSETYVYKETERSRYLLTFLKVVGFQYSKEQ